MISKSSFSKDQYNQILDVLALIAWKIELQEHQENSRNLNLAINTVISVADNFAFKPFETSLKSDLRPYLELLINDEDRKREFSEVQSIRESLRSVLKFYSALSEEREKKIFSDFVFRFASRLSEVSGQTFAGFKKRLDAGEATILLHIKEEFSK